jgi:hypothetical protein
LLEDWVIAYILFFIYNNTEVWLIDTWHLCEYLPCPPWLKKIYLAVGHLCAAG